MPTDLTVVLEDRPGTLADMAGALGGAGINIDGICGFRAGDRGVIHVLVEDAAAARRRLTDAGIEVRDERPVLVTDIQDRPGELARVARRIADAGANIEAVYLAARTRLVIGADDLERARRALGA